MTIPKTDVSTLSKLIGTGSFETALPCNLTDEVLLQIARDLRTIEISCTIDESVDPPLSGPIYLYSHLLYGQAAKLTGKKVVGFDVGRLDHWMQRYLHYIEREVVSRAVKLKYPPDTDDLIAEIQKEVLAVK
jgi:hypothetical protein